MKNLLDMIRFTQVIKDPFPSISHRKISIYEAYKTGYDKAYQEIEEGLRVSDSREIRKIKEGYSQLKQFAKEAIKELSYYGGEDVYNNPWEMAGDNDDHEKIENGDMESDPWDEDYMTSWGGRSARKFLASEATTKIKEMI